MRRFPHSLTFRWSLSPSLDPSTGRPTEGLPVERLIYCRYEMGGSGRFVPSEGGVQLAYSYVIFAYPMPYKIPEGATVEIKGRTYTVIRMDNSQLHTRIWV